MIRTEQRSRKQKNGAHKVNLYDFGRCKIARRTYSSFSPANKTVYWLYAHSIRSMQPVIIFVYKCKTDDGGCGRRQYAQCRVVIDIFVSVDARFLLLLDVVLLIFIAAPQAIFICSFSVRLSTASVAQSELGQWCASVSALYANLMSDRFASLQP